MDQVKSTISKSVYIELELVLDIYSLVFCNVRFYLDTNFGIQIDNKDVATLYGKQLKQGVSDILILKLSDENLEQVSIDDHVANVIKIFEDSVMSLKPTVPSIHVINQLKKNENVWIKLFTYLEENINTMLEQTFSTIVNEMITIGKFLEGESIADDSVIVFGCLTYAKEFERMTETNKLTLINIPHPKEENNAEEFGVEIYRSLDKVPFENFDLPKIDPWFEGSLLRVELNKEFKTAELPFWRKTIPLEKIELSGRVVNGYKRGSKELGVPTANLEMCPDNIKKIENLLPGVYSGTVQFITAESNSEELAEKYGEGFMEKKLRTALSIGWNPSYDNSQRTIESYILDEFENDFYGEELKIEITNYIRAESNYSSLDHLIMAIHNDIETTKHNISVE